LADLFEGDEAFFPERAQAFVNGGQHFRGLFLGVVEPVPERFAVLGR